MEHLEDGPFGSGYSDRVFAPLEPRKPGRHGVAEQVGATVSEPNVPRVIQEPRGQALALLAEEKHFLLRSELEIVGHALKRQSGQTGSMNR